MNNYKILNISPGSSQDEIKKAYRKLILKCHPDKLPPYLRTKKAEKKIIKIKEVYENLTKSECKSKPKKPKSSKSDYLNEIINDFVYVPYSQSYPYSEKNDKKLKEASRAVQDAVFKYRVRSH